MAIYPTNGSKLYIGNAVADTDDDLVDADFNAQSWVEVGGITNLGEVGDQSELIQANLISLNRTKKAKGTANAGSMAIVAAADWANTGQLALRAAAKTDDNYAFRLVFNDSPPGGVNSERKFIGLVMGSRYQFNEANNITNLMGAIEVNSNIVELDAHA